MRGLFRLTYYANRLQAQDDYANLARVVSQAGHPGLADHYRPLPTASIKQIDRAIANLRKAYKLAIGEI